MAPLLDVVFSSVSTPLLAQRAVVQERPSLSRSTLAWLTLIVRGLDRRRLLESCSVAGAPPQAECTGESRGGLKLGDVALDMSWAMRHTRGEMHGGITRRAKVGRCRARYGVGDASYARQNARGNHAVG